jgi:hypothetical protein
MRQFVCQETLAAMGFWAIHPLTENDVLSYRVGSGLQLTRGLDRLAVRVYTDMCEVLAKPWLEEIACSGIKRLPRRESDFVDNGGDRIPLTRTLST